MSEHSQHIVSAGLYWLVWSILIVCTVLTAGVATVDLGKFNTVVALSIATFKATLVVLIFMQVKYTSEKMTKAVLLFAIAWLILLLSLSLIDYSSRFAG
jgi:cytochrome c oxidase subunit 4